MSKFYSIILSLFIPIALLGFDYPQDNNNPHLFQLLNNAIAKAKNIQQYLQTLDEDIKQFAITPEEQIALIDFLNKLTTDLSRTEKTIQPRQESHAHEFTQPHYPTPNQIDLTSYTESMQAIQPYYPITNQIHLPNAENEENPEEEPEEVTLLSSQTIIHGVMMENKKRYGAPNDRLEQTLQKFIIGPLVNPSLARLIQQSYPEFNLKTPRYPIQQFYPDEATESPMKKSRQS